MRTVEVNGFTFGYMIFKHNAVIKMPNEKKIVVDASLLKKDSKKSPICAADVKDFIVKMENERLSTTQ